MSTRLSQLFVVCGLAYVGAYIYALRGKWFRSVVTTDDARQQSYIFHQVYNPELFVGDFVTESMQSYLTPLHYWISYGVTLLMVDPVMTGHAVCLIQLLLTLVPLFFFVRHYTPAGVAAFAVVWFLHTEKFVRTTTGGLPRGWMAPLLACFLFLLAKRKHKSILALLAVGILLNPMAAFVSGATYGATLLFDIARKKENARKAFLALVLASPIYLAEVTLVLDRPESVGKMVSLKEALQMPSLSRAGGRFAFLPFADPLEEISSKGFISFFSPRFKSDTARISLVVVLVGLFIVGLLRKQKSFPAEAVILGAMSLTCYFLARFLAFKLYVPERYLIVPIGLSIILGTTIAIYRSLESQRAWQYLGLTSLAVMLYVSSGSGIGGHLNYNIRARENSGLHKWFRQETSVDSLVAGNPTQIDAMQLFGQRSAYITTETAHPFFDRYWAEASRRLELVWRAYYETDIQRFLQNLQREGITHFVFRKADFFPDANAHYFRPFDKLVRELSQRESLVYDVFLSHKKLKKLGVTPFRDRQSLVISVKALETHLEHLIELSRISSQEKGDIPR